MIDVAERIFVRIAEQVIKKEITSIREVFADNIFQAEIDGQFIELLSPEGLDAGIQLLGINDLTDKESKYLLRVLTKPELSGTIVVAELLQIMENLGLYDEQEDMDGEQAELEAEMRQMQQQQLQEESP